MPDEYISREAARRMVNQLPRYTWSSPVSTDYCVAVSKDAVLFGLDRIPAADVAPVVRCKDCAKHYVVRGRDMCAKNAQGSGEHWIGLSATVPDGFCHRGVRK